MYNADRPLSDRSADALGIAPLADLIADKLSALQPSDGLVVGLQSPWGMGKSSFLNLMVERLGENSHTIIIRFLPWLVDNRDSLLKELFSVLSDGLEHAERKAAHRWDVEDYRRRRLIAEQLRKFALLADRLKSVPSATHLSWFKDLLALPFIREIAATLRFIISSVAAFKPRNETLGKLRGRICARLRLLDRKIIVIIDDVDRLDEAEVKEVFRLIRAVADFPNIVYVVAFDRNPLSVEANAAPDIKRAYLDKIIQVPIFLPEPEPVDLRRLLLSRLIGVGMDEGVVGRALRDTDDSTLTSTEQQRFYAMIDPLVRTYINSPRRIMIMENIFLTAWQSISNDADLSDFLIYQCLLNFDRPLYSWVEDYISLYRSGRRMRREPTRAQELRQRLEVLLNGALKYREDRLVLLRSLLPAIRGY